MRRSARGKRAWLALETGEVYEGDSIGAQGSSRGEAVFTTSMTGYVEVLTDPSFYGQIVVQTYPHIGNHGVQLQDAESAAPRAAGYVVADAARERRDNDHGPDISSFLKKKGIVAVSGVPTREITLRLREAGALRALVTTERASPRALAAAARSGPLMSGRALAAEVTAAKPYLWKTRRWEGRRVAVADFGVKGSILEALRLAGASVKVFPASTPASLLIKENPAGVVLSNGPGDPAAMGREVAEVRELLRAGIPLLGVCLGHQLIGLAAGGRTYKLKFGHHGANHPVRDERTGRILITTQNHGFAVRPESLPRDYAPTHVSLNDGTLEGFRHRRRKVAAYQFHPEGGPGPTESRSLLAEFVAGL